MDPLDHVADEIVHGARESFLRSLTNALVGALKALVSGAGSEARAANALDMASARVAEQAMGVWAEHRPLVTAHAAREVGKALRDNDETLQRELAQATGADAPSGLTNRARNDLAQATRGVREVVGRRNVRYEPTEARAIAERAAATEAMQGAADAHHAAQAWYEVAGAAITRTDMGDDPDAVLNDAVAELARRGLETVDYLSGRRTTIDAAVRRHIDSQLNQAANDAAIRQCEEWGVGLVMVDAHWGARPSHAAWQGRAYSLHGEVEVDGVTYPDLYEATGYQGRNGWPLGAQLAGVNCRHRIAPYVPGVSQIQSDDFDAMAKKYGMSSEEYYEQTQRQRALERELRAAKREAAFLEDGSLDATAQRYRIGELQAKLREHCKKTGLERDPSRERAYGVTHQPRGLKRPEPRTLSSYLAGDEAEGVRTKAGLTKKALAGAVRTRLEDLGIDARSFARIDRDIQKAILESAAETESSGKFKRTDRKRRQDDVRLATVCRRPVFIPSRGVDPEQLLKNRRLKQYVKKIKPEEGFYDVHAHGKRTSIECFTSDISAETLAYILRKRKDYTGGPVRLFCCHTGERDEDGDCFAQRLADILGVEVKAPPTATTVRSDGFFYFGDPSNRDFNIFTPTEGGNR